MTVMRPLTRHQATRLRALAVEGATVTVHWIGGDAHSLVKGKLEPPDAAIQAQLDSEGALA